MGFEAPQAKSRPSRSAPEPTESEHKIIPFKKAQMTFMLHAMLWKLLPLIVGAVSLISVTVLGGVGMFLLGKPAGQVLAIALCVKPVGCC